MRTLKSLIVSLYTILTKKHFNFTSDFVYMYIVVHIPSSIFRLHYRCRTVSKPRLQIGCQISCIKMDTMSQTCYSKLQGCFYNFADSKYCSIYNVLTTLQQCFKCYYCIPYFLGETLSIFNMIYLTPFLLQIQVVTNKTGIF